MLSRVLVALAFAMVMCGQIEAADCEAFKDLQPKDLVVFLRTSAHAADPQCVTDAIIRLGDSRPKERGSIELLISLLDFRRPETEAERMHVSSNRDWFPAVSALVGAGKPAVEPLIERLKTNEMTETARQNGIRALLYIHSGDPPQAVDALMKAAKAATSQVEAVALETTARDAAKQCAKSVRNRCEAVLNQR
ncbi:MAG: hypothetical protein ACRD2M_01480 [Terriglobales bacterium]